MALLPLAGCDSSESEPVVVADYGSYGADLAHELAASFPYRAPGASEEEKAGDFVIKAFEDLGYKPIVTEFAFLDSSSGEMKHSRNIAVLIKGSGFTQTDTDGVTQELKRQVIVGAHYDTPASLEGLAADQQTASTSGSGDTAETTREIDLQEPTWLDYDGIHDNASGMAALLTAAKEMVSVQYGYDVILIAFGAGSSDQAGARYYVSQMSKNDIASTDAMYCLDSIYAGDKVYAHAGHNSIKANYMKDYDMRRKLYEATDVFYQYQLYTNNRFMLYTNMASFDVTVDNIPTPVLYREWTFNPSDYRPFDDAGIPIVFFESYNYDGKTLESMQESKNPAFGSTSGVIRGTPNDSAAYLAQILNTARTSVTNSATPGAAPLDQLTRRINNIAFIIVEAIKKGPPGATAR